MSRCPIVQPDVVRLSLSQGDFLDVKKQLNTGEYRAMIAGQYKEVTEGGRFVVDLNRMGMGRIVVYVVGWSFVDLEGKPLPFNEAVLKSIDVDTFQEILESVDAHHAKGEAEMEARKNGRGTEIGSPATSLSPDAATGAMSGLPN